MKKLASKFISKTVSFLKEPYPFYYYKNSLRIIAPLLFVMTLSFEYFLKPFEVYPPEHKMDHFWIAAIHATTPATVILLLLFIKAPHKLEENWKVYKEILLIALFFLTVGLVQFLIRDLIYDNPNNWSFRYAFEEIRNTFLIGTLFAILLISLNYNRLNSKNKRLAIAQNFHGKARNESIKDLVEVKTQVKSDDFVFALDKFYYAKSDGNYTEFYLKNAEMQKEIKRISIKELESTLKRYDHIFRTHRSFLVNLKHLSKVAGNAQGYTLTLKNCEQKIPVSRKMIAAFNKRIASL